MLVDVFVDRLLKFGSGSEGTAPDALICDQGKKAFDLIEPTGVSGSKVQVPMWALLQPLIDFDGLVSRVVIQNNMDIQTLGHFPLDLLQESEELTTAVPFFQATDDPPGGHIQSSEQ